jgi:hypothetical protein
VNILPSTFGRCFKVVLAIALNKLQARCIWQFANTLINVENIKVRRMHIGEAYSKLAHPGVISGFLRIRVMYLFLFCKRGEKGL